MKPGARQVAACFLLSVDRGRHCDALWSEPGFLALESRDRKLVTELVYGTLRHRNRLDFYLHRFSNRPLRKLDAEVLWVLRLGLYQLDFLRIPHQVAVHESVGLCGLLNKKSAGSFVNAVLRSFLRDRPQLPEGRGIGDLAVWHSHPEWLVRRYVDRYGVEVAVEFMEQNNSQPASVLWVNPFKVDFAAFCEQLAQEGIEFQESSRLPNCLAVPADFVSHPLYEQGLGFFMDVSSQAVAHQVGATGQIIGDFCAAPGGKSFLLASMLASSARLFCSDISVTRLQEMKRRAHLYRVPDLRFFAADWSLSSPVRAVFDSILLDVPCSGLGTIRSNPDIRWRVTESDLQQQHLRQFDLLKSAFSCLKEGGELLYSTCSTEPEENEGVIEEFLGEEADAIMVGEFFRTFPGSCPGDAFFAARIRHA